MNAVALLCFVCLLPAVVALGFVNSQLPQIPRFNKNAHVVGKVDPRLKSALTYVQEFAPWHDNVLLSVEQSNFELEAQNYRYATVVAVGPNIKHTTELYEGATVMVDATCVSMWSNAASFLAKYPMHTALSRSMPGRYVNGISLNNAHPWTMNNRQTSTTEAEIDSNQQYNYLVCPEGNIVALINGQNEWGANRADKHTSYIQKPTYHKDTYPEFWLKAD
eukprot:NODE_1926_length_865_cov_321.857843_g1346_i0.p2 GENE.NODE_1926_length_865_cov_321.857843_g1346_i0~~NODE_1926_length_865_cov_321.857843_g1346_i0.p2  ORF type:complete len:220 (+),score=64.90 NODE_1926_length_865_cov_321.857843_g1346_i0:59-718(+)